MYSNNQVHVNLDKFSTYASDRNQATNIHFPRVAQAMKIMFLGPL